MPEDFKNLNAAKVFAGDFSQEQKGPSGLVGGGSGLVGSHLLARSDRAAMLANLPVERLADMAHHAANQRFTPIREDACDPVPIAGAVDVIVNLGCPASPPTYRIAPVRKFKTAAPTAMNQLEPARLKRWRVGGPDRTIARSEPETDQAADKQASRQKECVQ